VTMPSTSARAAGRSAETPIAVAREGTSRGKGYPSSAQAEWISAKASRSRRIRMRRSWALFRLVRKSQRYASWRAPALAVITSSREAPGWSAR